MEKIFESIYGKKPEKIISAAGRINVIGEHIDYCGGMVLPAALNLNCTVLVRKNGSNTINLKTSNLMMDVAIDIDKLDSYRNLELGNYQAGVAYELQKSGYKLAGCDLMYFISIPFGSGLSSSAAIEVSTAVALLEVAGYKYELKSIALLAQKTENEYCGVSCGIMDQFASAMGKKDKAVLLNCKSLDYQYVPLDLGDYTFVVANCNKPHNLINSKYNERRSEVELALEKIKKIDSSIVCLADLSLEAFDKVKHVLDGKILDRATHIVMECDRVNKAVKCLRDGDVVELGKLISASHRSLAELYEVTGKEPDALAYASQAFKDCLGARMIGGGFGGCVISLVKKDSVPTFIEEVGKNYLSEVGYEASFYRTSIEDGVTVKEL